MLLKQHFNNHGTKFHEIICIPIDLYVSFGRGRRSGSADQSGAQPAGSHGQHEPGYLHSSHGELFAERDNLTVR